MIAKMWKPDPRVVIADPPLARALFNRASLAWLWLVVRVYLGYQWLESGIGKVSDPRWMGDGSALLSYWQRAVAMPAPPARPPISYDWYRGFLQALIDGQAHTWFAKLITFGETAVGLGLIVGAFVGLAAFFGAVMNMNYMLAGSASSNPVFFLLAILLILAWKTAGLLGADRFLLPLLAPWKHRPEERPIEEAPAARPKTRYTTISEPDDGTRGIAA
jgi:thiosulfate dehydrogenase [quinone] large subunit